MSNLPKPQVPPKPVKPTMWPTAPSLKPDAKFMLRLVHLGDVNSKAIQEAWKFNQKTRFATPEEWDRRNDTVFQERRA